MEFRAAKVCGLAHVAFGSIATESDLSGYFRSSPHNGRRQTGPVGPVRADSDRTAAAGFVSVLEKMRDFLRDEKRFSLKSE